MRHPAPRRADGRSSHAGHRATRQSQRCPATKPYALDARERQQAPVRDKKMESGVNSVKRLIFTWNLTKTSSLWCFALACMRCDYPLSGVSALRVPGESGSPRREMRAAHDRNGSGRSADGKEGAASHTWLPEMAAELLQLPGYSSSGRRLLEELCSLFGIVRAQPALDSQGTGALTRVSALVG